MAPIDWPGVLAYAKQLTKAVAYTGGVLLGCFVAVTPWVIWANASKAEFAIMALLTYLMLQSWRR